MQAVAELTKTNVWEIKANIWETVVNKKYGSFKHFRNVCVYSWISFLQAAFHVFH